MKMQLNRYQSILPQYYYKDKISNNVFFKQGFQYTTNKNLDFSPSNGVWESLTQSINLKLSSML